MVLTCSILCTPGLNNIYFIILRVSGAKRRHVLYM
jgi:hypothetical protein